MAHFSNYVDFMLKLHVVEFGDIRSVSKITVFFKYPTKIERKKRKINFVFNFDPQYVANGLPLVALLALNATLGFTVIANEAIIQRCQNKILRVITGAS